MAYGIRERAVMIALAALGGEASNTVLATTYRLDLPKKYRDRLNADGLIESQKGSRSFTHALTDKGWAHVETEMAAEVPARSGSAAGALFALLAGLKPAATRAGGLKGFWLAQVQCPRSLPPKATSGIRSVPPIVPLRSDPRIGSCYASFVPASVALRNPKSSRHLSECSSTRRSISP